LDAEAGFLWTGDSFYEGPIWLYFPETDLAAYRKPIARIAAMASQLNALFPALVTYNLVAPWQRLQRGRSLIVSIPEKNKKVVEFRDGIYT
jgi:hypothetical protein